ncbi:MAG TPA: GPW/gp25 family protein [Puia sp.]|jgi:phage baseplate assembly protein W|nr:GPW/gp25 family protein [Puia sp.]
MQQEYYSLPLTLERVMNKQEHAKVSMQQSVSQHLHLLLTTAFGGFPANERFGCGIWEYDFDNVTSAHKMKEWIRQSLLEVIALQEKRLTNIRVEVLLRQEEVTDITAGRRIKKKIDISITGQLGLTNERFTYRDNFFVGPLSY